MEPSPNLTPARGPSVWSRDRRHLVRRVLTGSAGVGLFAAALAQRGARRAALACAGAALVAAARPDRGVRVLAHRMRGQVERWYRPADVVNEASEESFPASDSPSWSPAIAGAPERPRRR